MKPELSNIIGAMITNIGAAREKFYDRNLIGMNLIALQTAEGIAKLEMLWPNLTTEEKQEIKAVVEAIKTSYSLVDDKYIEKHKKR